MSVKLVQPAKNMPLVTEVPIATLVRLEQPSNAVPSKKVTLSGMVRLMRLVQPLNAWTLMLVTLSGIVTLVRLEQS